MPGQRVVAVVGEVPYGDGLAQTNGRQEFLIGRKGQRGDAMWGADELAPAVTRRGVPEADFVILTPRGERFSVRGKGDGQGRFMPPGQPTSGLARGNVPQSDRGIGTG